jgi:hypothetical protein
MGARATEALGGAASRVGHGWEEARRARYAALAPRYLATAALLVFLALGVRAMFFAPQPSPPPPPRGAADAPSEDFALQFARAYLSYDAARPGARARALAPFLSEGLDSGAGFFAAAGERRVRWAQVASDQRALAGGRVITVAAGVSTQPAPVYLAVTVRHERGAPLALVGYPAFVGAPSIERASAPPPRSEVEDPAVRAVVERVIRNYLAGSAPNLKADLTPEAVVTLPTVAARAQSIDQILWAGGPDSGAVLVTVTATDSRAATYTLAYELGIAYRERPYVDFIEVIPTDS